MARTQVDDRVSELRFAPHHHGRVMRLTLSRGFIDETGPGGVNAYVDTLITVAADHSRSVTQTIEALRVGWGRAGVRVGDIDAERTAELLADPQRVGLIVEDDEGHRYAGGATELAEAVYDDGYHEPQDPHRPFYS